MTTASPTTENTQKHSIPMFQAGRAIQSLRDSGHSLPTALGEVIDNSIEARASKINIILDESKNKKGKKHVHRIIITDDGEGMDLDTLHHYLVMGYSSRYMRTDTIGKYGVGAKIAALNFGRKIDVWSRQKPDKPWLSVNFDLNIALEEEEQGNSWGILPPTERLPSSELSALFPKGSGTVVVWSNVDRLEEGRHADNFDALRVVVEKELSRMFRNFISGGIKIYVNGKSLLPHDPLFLMEDCWETNAIRKYYEKENGEKLSFSDCVAHEIYNEQLKVDGKLMARLIVTLYPEKVCRSRGMGGDSFAKELRIPENEGCISFVRLNREISYTAPAKILPAGVQPGDRFIGIEVSFNPELDDYFGVRNVKKGVEPHGELRKQLRTILRGQILKARQKLEEYWGKASKEKQEHYGQHSEITQAVKSIDPTMPHSKVADNKTEEDFQKEIKALALDVVGSDEKAQQEYIKERKDLPFIIESIDFPGNMFLTTEHIKGKVIIRLNTRHPFYRDMWEPIQNLANRDAGEISGQETVRIAKRTIEALTLLIIAYGKAESMHENPVEQYGDLQSYWGQFLATLMGKIRDIL